MGTNGRLHSGGGAILLTIQRAKANNYSEVLGNSTCRQSLTPVALPCPLRPPPGREFLLLIGQGVRQHPLPPHPPQRMRATAAGSLPAVGQMVSAQG